MVDSINRILIDGAEREPVYKKKEELSCCGRWTICSMYPATDRKIR